MKNASSLHSTRRVISVDEIDLRTYVEGWGPKRKKEGELAAISRVKPKRQLEQKMRRTFAELERRRRRGPCRKRSDRTENPEKAWW